MIGLNLVYATGRQCIMVEHSAGLTVRSQWEMTRYRVPEGYILGRFLFILYMNDHNRVVDDRVV